MPASTRKTCMARFSESLPMYEHYQEQTVDDVSQDVLVIKNSGGSATRPE
jgi:hypothetical protein